MANYLLSLQFDVTGCTNHIMKNLGGVSFNTKSPISNLRAAYFEPYNMNSGLIGYIPNLKDSIENNDFSIYFKYKIRKDDNISNAPIITYEDEYHTISKDFLSLIDNKYFSITTSNTYTTDDISYTFDNNWHTFYLYKKDKELAFFIDGYPNTIHNPIPQLYINDKIAIGYREEIGYIDNFIGYIDDFNIFSGIIYENPFVPPSEYIYINDVISNYKEGHKIQKEDFETDLINHIEYLRDHTADKLDEIQQGLLPKPIKCTWKQIKDGYFDTYNYNFNMKDDKRIFINITNLDVSMVSCSEKYYTRNLETALENKEIYPLMIFLNRRLVRLSKITVIKSDDWYTLIIDDDTIDRIVESLYIILIPFPIVYEEDYGERADLMPLYVFDKYGLFTPSNGTTYYYIDTYKTNIVKQIGIREHYLTKNEFKYSKIDEEEKPTYMNFLWRYGTLETIRVEEDNAYMQFISEDRYGQVKPGDKVIIYNGTTLLREEFYKVVGYDLLYITDISKCNIIPGRTVTMQVVTDLQNNKDTMLSEDLTDIKIIEVEATKNKQSKIYIPEVYDDNGERYSKFLVFKGHTLMEDKDRYTIDYDDWSITLTNPKDYLTIRKSIIFIFVKLRKTNSKGQVYVKPIMYYCSPNKEYPYKFTIPNTDTVVNKNNIMIFANTTFISPYRYTIENNEVILDEEDTFNPNANIIMIMLKTLSSLEDPVTWRERMIQDQINKGDRFILYDLNIDKKFKITLNNLLCFDDEGYLVDTIIGKIYNYNIIKSLRTNTPLETQIRYLTCVYRDDSMENLSNLNRYSNSTFLYEYIKGREEFFELDEKFEELMEDFNFTHRYDLSYGENLSMSLDYIIYYNQNKIDEVYEKRATTFRRVYDTNKFNLLLSKNKDRYSISIPKDDYETNNKRTYPLFFKNGILADWDIEEDVNNTIISLPMRVDPNTHIESINFKNMSNFLQPLSTNIVADKQVSYELDSKLVTGYEYNTYFYGDIVVTEELNIDIINCSIIVDDIYEPQEVKLVYEQDLFTCVITPRVESNFFLDASINIPQDPIGTEIDYEDYYLNGNTYDIICTIETEQKEENIS